MGHKSLRGDARMPSWRYWGCSVSWFRDLLGIDFQLWCMGLSTTYTSFKRVIKEMLVHLLYFCTPLPKLLSLSKPGPRLTSSPCMLLLATTAFLFWVVAIHSRKVHMVLDTEEPISLQPHVSLLYEPWCWSKETLNSLFWTRMRSPVRAASSRAF